MSQIYKPYRPDVLMLNMVANGTTTASGGTYDLDIGDDSVFAVSASRGTSITLDSVDDHKLNLDAGLYEINFNGWVQTSDTVTGLLDYQMQISSNPIFAITDVAYDRLILYYDSVTAVIDPSHTTLFNVTSATSIYFRIGLANDNGRTWYLRGDPASVLTNLQISRVSEAIQ